MRATIRKPDGTTVEAEGTPEEIARLAGLSAAPWPVYSIAIPQESTTGWLAGSVYVGGACVATTDGAPVSLVATT